MASGDRRSTIITVGCGHGAPDRGCADGPAALRRDGLPLRLLRRAPRTCWIDVAVISSQQQTNDSVVAEACDHLAAAVEGERRRGRFPIIIGGDHSIAVGTWTGIRRSLDGVSDFRLIWIDAHMDCHVPQTSPSAALHGMPVACLMGRCHPRLVAACPCPALSPGCIRLVGVRDFEAEEPILAAEMGVTVSSMADLTRRGLDVILAEAAGDGLFGISLDLDAIDPIDAPGVGTPVEGGIRGNKLLTVLAPLLASPLCLGLEIAEFNPSHDIDHRTALLIEALIDAAVHPEGARHEQDHRA
jgi:arginase